MGHPENNDHLFLDIYILTNPSFFVSILFFVVRFLLCDEQAGQESFRSITRSYYRGAAGALLGKSRTLLGS